MKSLVKLSNCKVFIDFDNTITAVDTLDEIIERYSINKDWIRWEKLWKEGKISSKECLKEQLGLVRITRGELLKYLSKIKIAKGVRGFLGMLKKNKVYPVVLSDNFSFIIRSILKSNGISAVKIYSNRMQIAKNRLSLYFPHTDKQCPLCGHCKKKNLKNNQSQGKITIYIGDGLSDACPAQFADIVFAKADLLSQLEKKGIPCIPFRDFRDIENYLRRQLR